MSDLVLVSNRSGLVRRETLAGREYLVAPVVAIRAGVLNGELALEEEISAFVEAWNGIPVPLGHPMKRGIPISANSPDLEATIIVGRFWNAEMDGDRLRGEIWVDIDKALALPGQAGEDAKLAIERMEEGTGIEVSTAFFRELEDRSGTFKGVPYEGVQRNLRPDHLALLLHEIGACSWKDGCGVPRINVQTNQHTGVMIALYPSAEVAARLAQLTGELPEGSIGTPAEEMHLTLGYLGDTGKNEVTIDQVNLMEWVMNFARNSVVVRGQVNGVARFLGREGDGTQALVALYDCEYLNSFRNWLVDPLPVKRNHGFTPHITLAYLPADAATPDIRFEPMEIVFDRIGVAWAGQVTMFELQGVPATLGEAVGAEVGANAMNANQGFNPVTLAKSALRGLAHLFGFPTGPEGGEAEPPAANTIETAPDGGQTPIEEVISMDREQLIEKLAANAQCPFDKAELGALPDSALTKLEQKLESGCPGNQPAANADLQVNTATLEGVEASPEVMEISALVQELGGMSGVKAALEAIKANADAQKTAEDARKSELVVELRANERCAFDEADLQAMSLAQLDKLAESLRPANYAGRGGPRGNSNGSSAEHQVPAPPAIILATAE